MSTGHIATAMHGAAQGLDQQDLAARSDRRVILEARGLHKSYPTGATQLTVLAAVDLKLVEGEMVAIVAPSGAGKSTLLHLLAALDTPTSGTVYFDATPIDSKTPAAVAQFRNRAVGFVWQRHHLLPDFTAIENVALPLLLRGESRDKALQCASQWLSEVGLSARTHHRTGELSGGEQQRVAIARALVSAPAVLLADEPTGDLDEKNAVAVFDLIERLHRAHRLTSLIATHNVALAGRCDRVMCLEHGVLKLRSVGLTKMGSTSGGEKS
jgi:lipoprotein-releasing system ATP-binding protein